MPRDVVEFSPNVPVQWLWPMDRERSSTPEMGQRVMFTLVDGRVMFFDLDVCTAYQRVAAETPRALLPGEEPAEQEGEARFDGAPGAHRTNGLGSKGTERSRFPRVRPRRVCNHPPRSRSPPRARTKRHTQLGW